MDQLDEALRRLDGAVARLESAVDHGNSANGADGGSDLHAERDRLAEEVSRLRARAAEDARLRAEAAAAVRDALTDLRGAIGQGAEEVRGNA
jgi:hypothetical protein